MAISVDERLSLAPAQWQASVDQSFAALRVAAPGIIQSFDPTGQTVTVQLAVNERIDLGQGVQSVALPILSDVPIALPRGGGFTITVPVQQGDECLVIFADMCIDAWWQSGGTNNSHILPRRHSLSDGFAILGCWSQPRVLSNYSTTAAQLRSEDGETVVEVGAGEVTIKANTVTVQANIVSVTGSESVSISGNGQTTIDGKDFLQHTHSGVQTGSGISGPVV